MKKYSEYKDSGVEWIGEIPVGWFHSKLKWISKIYAGGTPSKNIDSFWENGTIPWLNSGSVNQDLIIEPSEYITEEAYKKSSAKWIPKNSLVMAIAGQGKTKGMVAQLNIKATCNQSMAAIIPHSNVNARYLKFWLNVNYLRIRGLAGSDQRDGLNLKMIGDINLPLPTFNQQTQIARYLDHQTGLIDAIIEKKEKLIIKLKEQRQAIINEAVTKGLNPNAKMKDSGIEWLGEIPEHWVIKRIKHTTYVKGRIGWQNLRAEDFREFGPFLVTGTDFNKGRIKWDTCNRVDEERFEQDPYIQLMEDDVLITKDGTIGKIAIVKDKPEKVTLNAGVFVTRPLCEDYLQDYFYWLLFSDVFSHFIDFNKSGATIQHLYQNVFNEFSFALPSRLEEQQVIIAYLESKTKKVDKLIDNVSSQLKKLKSYRQSIISEAVTGKIDVRDWQPKKEIIHENL